jgi:hypothetical protein
MIEYRKKAFWCQGKLTTGYVKTSLYTLPKSYSGVHNDIDTENQIPPPLSRLSSGQ